MRLVSADAKIFFDHKKLKNPASTVGQKTSNPLFFRYCLGRPNVPKDQLYIKLGCVCLWPSSGKGKGLLRRGGSINIK